MTEKTRPTLLFTALLGLVAMAGCSVTTPFEETVRAYTRSKASKRYFAKTPDGWSIALHRYEPQKPNGALPVILCHGLGYNSHFWDIDDEHNFPAYLRDLGYDVWLIDLRGCGESTTPGWVLLHGPPKPEKLLSMRFDKFDWTMDDIITKDIPTAIDFVKKTTGKDKVIWIGHSMGGMVFYGYMERLQRHDCEAFVALGSPMIIPQPPNNVMRDMKYFRAFMTALNNRVPALLGTLVGGEVTPIDTLFYNRSNMSSPVISKLCWTVTEDISQGLMNQMMEMIKKGRVIAADGSGFDYTAHMDRVHVPLFLVAAKLDNLCPPEAVRYNYAHVGSKKKDFALLARVNGYSVDYGHSDMILGKRARQEVFPLISQWLDKVSHVRRNVDRGARTSFALHNEFHILRCD